MNRLPLDQTFHNVAQRLFWFKPSEKAHPDTVRFVAYAMTHATPEDMQANT